MDRQNSDSPAGEVKRTPCHNGDIIILYCSEASGHIYCEPRSSKFTPITIHPQKTTLPNFPNVHFAAFRIMHVKASLHHRIDDAILDDNNGLKISKAVSDDDDDDEDEPANYELLTHVACGSTVKLQHIASKKFLTMMPSTPGWLSDDNDGKDNSIFRLLPAKHDKSWGEDLFYGDSLRLESVRHKGQRIQCVYNPLTSKYNLVLAVTGSIITVRPHAPISTSTHNNAINGGEVVTLKWGRIKGFASVIGSFVSEFLPDELKVKPNVGLRRWRDHQWQLRATPSSADTYFQLEKSSNPSSGECFLYGECCRIKHVLTQKYLTLKLAMKEHMIILQDYIESDESQLFKLTPYDDEHKLSEPVLSMDKVMFVCVQSNRVLSVNARRNLQNELSAHRDPLSQWFELKFSLLSEDNNPFSVKKVDDDGVKDIYFVIGLASLLSKCVLKVKSKDFCDAEDENGIKTFSREIEEQIDQLVIKLQSSLNTKRLANMLRISQVIDAMMVILGCIGTRTETALTFSSNVCLALKNYAKIANKKSRVRLSKKKFLDTLLSMVGKGVDVEGVLIELVKDDSGMNRLIKANLTATHIRTENLQVLDLLRVLGYNSNADVQNKILEKTRQQCEIESFDSNNDIIVALEAFIDQSVKEESDGYLTIPVQGHTYDYGTLTTEVVSDVVDNYGNFVKMEKRIKNFLKHERLHCLYGDGMFQGRNGIILEMLDAVYFLCERNVYMGYEHLAEIVKHLTEILDGHTDKLNQDEDFQGSNRFSMMSVPGNRYVFKIKTQILKILRFLLDQHLKTVLMLVLWDFKYLYLNSQASQQQITSIGNRYHIGDIMEVDEESDEEQMESIETQTNHLRHRALSTEEIAMKILSDYEEERQNDDDEPPEILQELLEHDIDTADASLIPTAQKRLRHLYRKSLPPRLDTDVSNQIGEMLLDLLDYEDGDLQVECAQFLYDLFSVEIKILSEAERSYFITPYSDNEKQRQMIAVGTVTDEEKLLAKMLKLQCDNVPKLIQTLMMFGDWCVDENDETRANVIIQGVAYSSGLFSKVLEYVLEYGQSDYFDQEDILRACFYLLRRIARGNSRVQKDLFKRFHDFIGIKIAVSSMIQLLNEIFSYNSDISEQLADPDIEQLFYTMIASSNPEHFELSVTLRAIIESLPTPTDLQEAISHLLLKHWSDNLGYILGPDNQVTRFNLLKQDIDNEPELCLLLNICDLLATSTEGECRFAEEVSRKFFSLDEMISILFDSDIPIHRKIPFARLTTWTYLNTERNSLNSCIELAKYSKLWSHIESIQVLMDDIVKMIVELKPKDKHILQLKLKTLNKLYFSVNGWMETSVELNQMGPAVEDESSPPLNALLIYLLEGIIPLITAFCSELALHLSGASDACNVELQLPIGILIEMGDTLVALVKTKVLESTGHLSRIKLCLEGMKKFFSLKDVPNQRLLTEELHLLKSLTVERNRAFSQNDLLEGENPEIHLNDTFQLYVKNYQQVYQETPGDVLAVALSDGVLPIFNGPSFKKIVQLFSDSDEVLRMNEKPLKVEKLLKLLKAIVKKQKRQGLQSAQLEAISIFTLQLLSSVVDSRIKNAPIGNAAIFREYYADVIFPIQKRLLEKGAVELLVDILHFAREDVAFQVLACLNVLLYSGNEEAQKKISDIISEESRSVFLRVQQILSTAQSNITQAKMTKVMNQFAATNYNPEDDDGDDKMALKLLRRNKSSTFASFSIDQQDMNDDSLLSSFGGGNFSGRRKIAGVEQTDIARLSASPHIMASIKSASFLGGKGAVNASAVDHRITVALNLLSWLCDGQKRNMQDILREQKLFSSSSIVSQVAFLFHGVMENLSHNNLAIAQSAVQSLIEMCAGNYENQELAFKGQVIVSIDQILKEEGFTSTSTQESLLKLKCSCIELVEVMVEETSKHSPQLGKWVFSHLTLRNFLFAMKEIWDEYTSLLHITNKDYLQKSVFRAYHVLRRVADYKNVTINTLVGFDAKNIKKCRFKKYFHEDYLEAKAMWEYCKFWSRSIEVVFRSDVGEEILTRAYFFFDPHKHLNENEKEEVLLKIKRNTPEEKLTDLLYWTKAVREYHTWKESLKKHPVGKWIISGATVRHFILYWLTIILNLLILFSFSSPDDYDPQSGVCSSNQNDNSCLYFQPIFNPATPTGYFIIKYVIGSLHSFLAIWMVVQHVLKNWKIFTFKILWFTKMMYDLKKGLRRRRYLYKIARLTNKYLCCGKVSAHHHVPNNYFQTSFFSFEPLYRIFFALFSCLGLVLSGYFYCGCMLYVFLKNSVLQYILKAVGKSAKQLLTVFILVLVVIYIYAVISFALVSNYFNPDNDQYCDTLFHCFVTITRLGLLDTLGSEIQFRPYSNYDSNFRVLGVRVIYDLVFFIIITVLGLNIVIAILVDRFSDLREDRDKIDDDNSSRCLVCSIPKDAFESKGLDFNAHWKKDHYVWNYIHYALYLDGIQENDHNALEKYIYEQIPSKHKAGSIDFYPLRRAKALPNYESKEENS